MNSKLLVVSLSFIVLFSLTGCFGTSETDDEGDNNGETGQVSNDDDTEDSFEENFPEPPGLTLYAGEETLDPVLGTYSWSVGNEDGTVTATEVDAAAPPELVRIIDPMEVTADTTIDLDFKEQPNRYTVRIWDEDNNVLSESDEVDLSGEGIVIYEVLAHWEQGTATYAFYLNIK
ncbi:hypothetical protein [Alkalibacterium sp. 20]|uniref:hypothetical protein n=1 Tax=Alkalibacterium sp. 20 TaxID=1798803 RepID=UPI00091EAF6C|nr:hypothetical protein [Alkalibacterium sp. 20]OJF94647.1 hypothetical protein AX762_01925 [Alkalibacterium sp. 20]